MSRLPIRARLTAVFAAAMVLVLAGAAAFVYGQLRGDLDETVTEGLAARADAVAALARQDGSGLGDRGDAAVSDPDEAFARIVAPDGGVLDSRGDAEGPVLTPAELQAAARQPVLVERDVRGIDGTARILARPLPGAPGSVVVVGQSLADRDEALTGLIASFAVGGPLAVILASVLGYGLATAALRPVEAMRRRAESISLGEDDERLPLPAARDEVHRLGVTLNEMLGRLRGSFQRERRFVADASHELRTPIAVLKTELEALLRRDDHAADTREALVAAAEEAERVARLAEDLLVLARASEGRLPVRREHIRARDALERVRERFGDRAAEHDRQITIDAPAEVHVDADPLRLGQALGNLVDNALRHGAGDVSLAARAAVAGGVEIDVSDEGAGFPPDFSERAFERFSRGDEARTRGGAGLGLSIVRAIAEAHGGSATVVPAEGRGARVRLWLPAGRRADERRGSQAELRNVPHHGEHIVEPSQESTP